MKAAARAVASLEPLVARGERPSRPDGPAEDLGAPRSSLYQPLRTLVDSDRVRTDAPGSPYALGIRALLTGTGYLDGDQRMPVVRPNLDEASDALGEIIHLAWLDGRDVAHLTTRESPEYPRALRRAGHASRPTPRARPRGPRPKRPSTSKRPLGSPRHGL